MRLRFFFILFADLLLLPLIGFSLLKTEMTIYGLRMAKGQLNIILHARQVEEVLRDAAVPDSVKTKLALIQEIRAFAFDSIGLVRNDNYTTYFDQKGKRLMYVVTACEPFELEPHLWHFPFIGDLPYKGFFDETKAKADERKLRSEGWDTDITGASGWSTLGFLKDPVLSRMLRLNEGELAELIIHELTHGTIFVKDDADYNENLASFIGEKGALWFLAARYGKDSPHYPRYAESKKEEIRREQFFIASAHRLDSLYRNFPAECDNSCMRQRKLGLFQQITLSYRRQFPTDSAYADRLAKRMLQSGNAFFMHYIRYEGRQQDFETEYAWLKFDLRKFVTVMKRRYK